MPSISEGNRHAVKWEVVHEIRRAVEGVNNPAGVDLGGASVFFGKHWNGSVGLVEALSNEVFARFVQLGDEIDRSLVHYFQFASALANQGAGFAGDLACELQHGCCGLSIINVTGPSLTNSTCMSAPNCPV